MGRNKATGRPISYVKKDHAVWSFKESISLAAKLAKGKGWPTKRPIEIQLLFLFDRTKDLQKNVSPQRIPAGFPTTISDLDNLEKSVLDSLGGVVFENDSQVCKMLAEKYYCAVGEKAQTFVSVKCL